MTIEITATPIPAPPPFKLGDIVELPSLRIAYSQTSYYIIIKYDNVYKYVNLATGDYRTKSGSLDGLLSSTPPIRKFTHMVLS